MRRNYWGRGPRKCCSEPSRKPSPGSMKSLELSPFLQAATLPGALRRGSTGRNLQAEVAQTCSASKKVAVKPASPSQGKADASGAMCWLQRAGTPEQKQPHQVHGVEDLHLSDGGAAWVCQVAVVVVYGQRTQACGNTRRQTRRVGSRRAPV